RLAWATGIRKQHRQVGQRRQVYAVRTEIILKIGESAAHQRFGLGHTIPWRSQDRHGEAEPLYKRALEAYERVLGNEHPDTLRSHVACYSDRLRHTSPFQKTVFGGPNWTQS